MSTSPTLISWRRKSSVRKVSSANFISMRTGGACPGEDAPFDRFPLLYIRLYPAQPEPVKLIRSHRQQIGLVAHTRKHILARHLDQNISLVAPQVQFDCLRGARKIIDHQHCLLAQSPHIGQYSVVGGIEKLNRSPAEHCGRSADRDDAAHPVEERMFAHVLPQHVHRRITIYRILDKGGTQTLWIRGRKAAVRSPVPLHRSPHSVTVP